jgi:HEAT repeat protein
LLIDPLRDELAWQKDAIEFNYVPWDREAHAEVRLAAVSALGQIGPAASSAVRILVKSLRDTRHEVRAAAACALGQLGKAGAPAVPKLVDTIEAGSIGASSVVGEALARLGQFAAPAVLKLLFRRKLAADARRKVVTAISWLGSGAKPGLPHLIELLQDEDPSIAAQVAKAMARLGHVACPAA